VDLERKVLPLMFEAYSSTIIGAANKSPTLDEWFAMQPQGER
jgi:hypothetical protein